MRTCMCYAVALVLCAAARAEFEEYTDLAAFFEASNEFVGKERFGEADLKSLFENYDAFKKMEITAGGEDGRFFKDGKYRYDLVLEDKAYVAWAKERHLDPKAWLQKTIRIMTLDAKERMEAAVTQAEAMLEEQAKKLESDRAQLREKSYQELKRSLDAALGAVKPLVAAFKAAPAISEEEADLFKKHRKELDRTFGGGKAEKGRGEEEGNVGK